MALTLTNPTLSDPVDKTEVEDNFTDVSNKFGNIVNADIHASANIAISKLNKSSQEMLVKLKVSVDELAAGWPASTSPHTPLDMFVLPGTSGDDSWTVADAQGWCNDIGAGTGTFSIVYGTYTAGTWADVATVYGTKTIAAEMDLGNPSTSTLALGAAPRGLILTGGTADATALATAAAGTTPDGMIEITVLLRRDLQ